mgnify:CR=1 FL=1
MKIIYLLLVSLVLTACAGTPPEPPSADGSPRIKINKEIPAEFKGLKAK